MRQENDVTTIEINGRPIGHDQPCFIIAEAGVNHNGSLENARRLIDVAVDAGADAVKFQTFDVDLLTAPEKIPAARHRLIFSRSLYPTCWVSSTLLRVSDFSYQFCSLRHIDSIPSLRFEMESGSNSRKLYSTWLWICLQSS